MQEQKVFTYNAENEKLVGIETLPDNTSGKLATVVLVHGFCVDKSDKGMFDPLAQLLAEAGFAAYRFDFSGRGESEGNYEKTALTKMKNDLAKILEFVKKQPKVDKKRIGILAQSLGTSVTVALEPKVNSIVLLGSIVHPKEVLRVSSPWKKLDENGISIKNRPNGEVVTISSQFWKDFDNYDLLKSVK
ncbi:MAG: alpha/beta fold hydrolase, partial [Candidatus Micrarchaeota archaeon]